MTDEDPKVTLARIDERLGGFIKSQTAWQKDCMAQTRNMHDSVDERVGGLSKIVECHHIRLDRVEQREKGRARILWIAAAGAITSAVGWLSSHWFGHGE